MRHAGVGRSIGWVFGMAAALLSPPAWSAGLPPVVESQPLQPGGKSSAPGAAVIPMKLEDRVARLERQIEGQALVDMQSKIDSLQQEVQDLRGSLEVQTHKAESLEQRQRDLYVDMDRRLRQIESKQTAAPAADAGSASAPADGGSAPAVATVATGAGAMAGAGAAAAAPGGAAASNESNAERDTYQKAFDLMKAGRYDECIAAFRNFLARYPDGEYSANAQYWVGEANYVLRRFDEAATEFGKVIDFFPDSNKAPDALLKLGFSQYELQQWDKAGQTLNRVIQQYPKSTARQLAESRLQRMRMEGH